ncbi:MAG TPA: fumarylacetoacetate hydrolase family protein [Burkholderiales bacterium]|nr:fumarylacetoacetate hydrolase family protein [Burkholderiales bacterium]
MKLATLKDGTRDGTLLVVSRDLKKALPADHIAPTLQAALDDWDYLSPQLQTLYEQLNAHPSKQAFRFDPAKAMAPLPRAHQFADGSSYLIHAELIRRSRGQKEFPAWWKKEPLMYQGCSDPFLGPRDDIVVADEDDGIDLEMELAIVTGDVPMGIERDKAAQHIRLFLVVNDVSLRNLIGHELGKGFGFFHAKPPSALSPVAVTPDELGDAWDGRKLRGTIRAWVNGELLGEPETGEDMQFDFPRLIVHAAKTRPLPAGSVIGSGTVSNRDRKRGAGCLFERRAEEILKKKEAKTPFLKYGDTVKIEMCDADGKPLFGAIEQTVVAPSRRGAAQAEPADADADESTEAATAE